MTGKKKVYGVGINDVPGSSETTCYIKWSSTLKRCYDTKWIQKYRPTYVNATVCDEWLTYSNYKAFYDANYFEGAVLDKDILFPGNKHYSPHTCVFVPEFINLIVVCNPPKGGKLFGTRKVENGYKAVITITGQSVTLKDDNGNDTFATEYEAHRHWQSFKGQHLVVAAEQYKNEYPNNFNQDVYDQLLWKAQIILEDIENNRPTYRY
ncbi:hypothetical protein ACNPN6_06715 [Enterobacter quasiroggenkampii]|uniref:hypothetical protein n=1 Tax=Enterobacter quasiroggenkampii TaxID=2497436 RepID=UPI003AAACFDF